MSTFAKSLSQLLILSLCALVTQNLLGDSPARDVSTAGSELYQPLIIIGEGWNQKLIFQNIEQISSEFAQPSRIRLHFFTQTGEPWAIPLQNHGPTEVIEIDIPIGGVAIVETQVLFHPQQLGWCKVELTDLTLDGYLLAQTVFRRQESSRPDFMTATPLVHDAYEYSTIFIDQTGWKYHGVGVLNADECPYSWCTDSANFRITFTDMDTGEQLINEVKSLGWGHLWWFSLTNDYPQTTNRRGLLRVIPEEAFDGMTSTFTLQFAPNGAFTALSTSNDNW